MTRTLDVDYLVVGAGASGMAFTDALIDHADVRVALVDRRDTVGGGHWRADYPFVRLHQSSTFYGVASTVLGGGTPDGGTRGRAARAGRPGDHLRYYDDALRTGWWAPGGSSSSAGATTGETALSSPRAGEQYEVPEQGRIVDARYLSPQIPAETPPRFGVAEGARVIPVNDVAGTEGTRASTWSWGRARPRPMPSSGCWAGMEADAICWVRPRDPWMLNRALIQPDPAIYLGMVAT